MAKEQYVNLTGCGHGRETLVQSESKTVEEDIVALSEDKLSLGYIAKTFDNDYSFQMEVNLNYNEAGEDEFLFW